jgi:hypothetical protein
MRENSHVKSRRLVSEGRIRVLTADSAHIAAEVRGDSAAIYTTGYTATEGWRCTCPALSVCSHIRALQLLWIAPTDAAGEPIFSPYVCRDCGTNTYRDGEFYTVADEVWDASGIPRDGGMLCIGCLERRIGRELTRADFALDSPPNTWQKFHRSDRLRDRMGLNDAGVTAA